MFPGWYFYAQEHAPKKECDLDLLRDGRSPITILQISRFNPKLTCICPQIHNELILIIIKTSLEGLGPGYDSILSENFLDQENSLIKKYSFPPNSVQVSTNFTWISKASKDLTVSSFTDSW